MTAADPSVAERERAQIVRRHVEQWGGRPRAHALVTDPLGFDPTMVVDVRRWLDPTRATDTVLAAIELGRVPAPGPWVLGVAVPAWLAAGGGFDLDTEAMAAWADGADVELTGGHVTGVVRLVPYGAWFDHLLIPVAGVVVAVATRDAGVRSHPAETVGADRCLTFELEHTPVEVMGEAPDMLPLPTLALAGELVGVADAALEVAVARVRDRRLFGRAVGSYQAIQHRLVDDHIAITNARFAALDAAALIDRGEYSVGEAHASCLLAIEAALDATATAHQVFGGEGYHADRDPGLLFRRARGLAPRLGGRRNHLQAIHRAAQLQAFVERGV